MTEQEALIESIRNSYKISSDANESDKENFQGLIGKLHRSLTKLAEDLYSKETHFVLELIQNADDNEYDHREPLLKFIFDDEKILIQNNEKGFADKNVKALCDVGQSTKSKNLGYIGEKGIGFKSVFRVTDEPHIFSNGFRFKFKRNDAENNLGYIVPHWIETAPEFIDENLTNILLPLKDDAKEHQLKFQEIEPELLLFLQKLSIIEIYPNSNEASIRYHKINENGLVKIKTSQSESHYKLIPKPLQVPETIQEEKRDLKETKLILGFPVTEKGAALINTDQKIFAFLPTRSYGFKFIIQADFLVPTSREDIHKDKKWNKWLRDNISNVFLEAVDKFKEDEQLKTTFYNYIPTENEIKDSFFSIAVKQLHKKLVESECVLTESGKWLKPAEIFRANEEIRSLIANEELKKFFNKEYISTAVERNADDKILESLGISTFSIDNLINCLKDNEWLENQSDEWFIELYSYLEKQSLGKQRLERIKKLKIIKLIDNELASPSEQRIFFPLSKRQSYGFEKRIPFINKKTLALNNKEEAGRVERFLQSIDVFKAQPFEIIENYILPDYENDSDNGWKSRGKELLLGYVRYIKDNFNDYKKESDKRLNSHKSQWQTKEDPLDRLKKGIWIFHKEEKGTNWYAKPNNLYLTKDYVNNNALEFLSEGIENIDFVHSLYIKTSIENIRLNSTKSKESRKKTKEKIEAETKEWNEFFRKLGMEIKPRITKTVERKWSERYAYHRDVTKYSSEIICSILHENNKDKNSILLKILDANWNYYDKFKVWQDRFHRGRDDWSFTDKPSDWFEKLMEANWLPATNGTLQKPSNLFLDKPEIKALLGDNVSYLAAEIENQEFIKALSINTTIDVETILEHLKRMVEDDCYDKEKFIKFYSYLDSNFVSYERLIKKNFAENELIFIPESVEKYVSSEKALWKDVSKVFGEQRFYLEKHYDSLKRFFVEKLGINEKPTPKDYADILCEMTDKDSIDKSDEEKILSIYKELNNSLKPDNKEVAITDEDWWDDFIHKGIYWTNKSAFWTNDNDVFVNDDEELYKLFQDKSSVAFLKLPSNSHPKLQYFLKETGLSYLSKAAKTHLPSAVETIPAEELSQKVRRLFPFILRYLYFNENDIYEKSKEDERLVKLKNLFCYGVDKLEVNYSLNEDSATQERSHYLDGSKLYVNLDFLDNYNRIAIELSKVFGNPQGLKDFISVLFLQRDLIAIEEYLKDGNIQELPESEKQIIEEITSIPAINDVSPEVLEENVNLPESDTKQKTHDQPLDNAVEEQDKNKDIDAEINADFGEDYEEFLENPVIQKESKKTSNTRNTDENGNQTFPEYKSQEECSPEEAGVRVSTLELKDPNAFTFSAPEEEENLSGRSTTGSTNNGDNEPSFRESLSQAEKMDIGRWGEEYSLKRIKEKLLQKYPAGSVSETSDGFNVMVNKKIVAKVYWLNKNSDVGKGYDIKIIENSGETFIEVKSTKTESKEIFQISGTQWRLAQLQQNNFYVYRVFNARTNRARLVEICNPAELFRTGHIIAQSITLKF